MFMMLAGDELDFITVVCSRYHHDGASLPLAMNRTVTRMGL
jgi:hypothetical protein